jgi:hypothetical protein
MKRNSLLLSITLLTTLLFVVIVACNRKFDAPPAYATPNITANTTIKALKAMHTSGGYDSIGTDIIIRGIVVGDDKSGNIYKAIYLQDSTGGICVSLNRSYLYGDYPVGRELYIKCKGLWLSEYGKNIQLGYIDKSIPNNPASAGIPSSLFDNFLIKGTLANTVTPRVVTIAQLNAAAARANSNPASDTLQNTLIQIKNVQFQSPGLIYADTSANKLSVSRTIMDCGGTTSVTYSSGYANFAGAPTPSGNGNITAIYIPYKSTSELLVRDTTDVKFTGSRCSGVPTVYFSESFPSITSKATIVSGQTTNTWLNIAEAGTAKYVGYVSGSTKMASVSGYAISPVGATQTSWFISPAITFPTGVSALSLSFACIDGYDNGATLKVLVSTNYDGSSTTPSTATWTDLGAAVPTGSTSSYSSASTVTVDLTAYAGKKVYLAFRYDGLSGGSVSGNPKTTTYEFGSIVVNGY